MMKEVVLLDLGDTLIQYYTRAEFPGILKQAIAGVQEYLCGEGLLNVSTESVWQRVDEENYEARDNSVRPLEDRLTRIFQLHNPADETIMTACRHFLKPIFAIAHCYEDVLPALRKLDQMGIRKAIISNTPWGSPANLWREEIAQFGLDKAVDAAFFCRDAGWRKPARQIFHYVLEQLQVNPQDCIFVGDNPKWDLLGPRAVGIEAILINRRGMIQATEEKQMKSLYELPKWLQT